MKHQPLFRHFLFLFVAISFNVSAQAGRPKLPLYIYQLEGKYGLCDAHKRPVVLTQYEDITKDDSFFIAQKAEHLFDVYSITGRYLGTCNASNLVSDTSIMAFWYDDFKRPPNYQVARYEFVMRNDVQRPRAAIYHRNGRIDTLPGRIEWYQTIRYTHYCIIDSGDSKGLASLLPYSMVLPVKYKEVVAKHYDRYMLGWNNEHDYCLVDLQGHTYDVGPEIKQAHEILYNTKILARDSAGHKLVFNAKGARVNTFKGFFWPNSPQIDGKTVVGMGDEIRLMDSTGQLTGSYPMVRKSMNIFGELYQTDSGLYSLSKGAYIIKCSDTSMRVYSQLSMALAYCASIKDTTYAYDAHGNTIFRGPRYLLGYRDANEYFVTLSGVHCYRNSTRQPHRVYNPSLTHHLSGTLDAVANGGGLLGFLGKRDGRWGLWRIATAEMKMNYPDICNDTFVNILAPAFDTIEDHGGIYKTVSSGRVQWYDHDGKLLVGGKPFQRLDNKALGGARIAYEVKAVPRQPYKPELMYTKMMVVDSTGKVVGQQPINITDHYPDWHLIKGDKVLYTDNVPKIWNAHTNKITTLDQLSLGEIIYDDNGPMAAIVSKMEKDKGGVQSFMEQKKQEQEGVYSLIEEKMIIPLGKYTHIRYLRYTPTSVSFYTEYDTRVVAIYDESGVVY